MAHYLPAGLATTLPPEPALDGSSDPSPAAPSGVELAVKPLMGLELEATRLPTATSD